MPIRQLRGVEEARLCASMMCSTEPWVTLERTFDECLGLLTDPTREVYVAEEGGGIRGFIILNLLGAFVGYIQSICVAAEERGSGIGTRLMRFAEQRIFRDHPNVFLCVSASNPKARALYQRLGYETIGELRDFLVTGGSEFLMRKTIAPLREFRT